MVFAFETYQINDDDFLKVGQFKGKLQFYSLISTSPRIFSSSFYLLMLLLGILVLLFFLSCFFGGGGPK